jgi:hypothetical protein
VDLAALIGAPPPAPCRDANEVTLLELTGSDAPHAQKQVLRDLNLEQSRPLDDPLLPMLERLRPHFELIKAVRFAHWEG